MKRVALLSLLGALVLSLPSAAHSAAGGDCAKGPGTFPGTGHPHGGHFVRCAKPTTPPTSEPPPIVEELPPPTVPPEVKAPPAAPEQEPEPTRKPKRPKPGPEKPVRLPGPREEPTRPPTRPPRARVTPSPDEGPTLLDLGVALGIGLGAAGVVVIAGYPPHVPAT